MALPRTASSASPTLRVAQSSRFTHRRPLDLAARRTDTRIKLCFQVGDVDHERAALVSRAVTMRDIHRFENIAFCDGVDPEGNVFQITS